MSTTVITEQRGSVLWIFLNRPEFKNAFSLEKAEALLKAVRKGVKQKDVSVIVLSGKGEAFSSGGDIKAMSETKRPKDFFLKISKVINTVVLEMKKSDKPVIAAIPGYTGGIALGLVLGTDLRVASTNAQFCAATIRIGLVANGSATYHLPRLVGLTKALEIFLTGEIVPAPEALRMGLINRVVAPEILEVETQKLAEKLAASPRKALGRLKKIVNDSWNSTLPVQLERERQAIAWSSTLPDFQEGIAAFLEKRKPTFNKK